MIPGAQHVFLPTKIGPEQRYKKQHFYIEYPKNRKMSITFDTGQLASICFDIRTRTAISHISRMVLFKKKIQKLQSCFLPTRIELNLAKFENFENAPNSNLIFFLASPCSKVSPKHQNLLF